MYQRLPSWVLGFHGTYEDIVQKALNDPKSHLRMSDNKYDWLGKGVYFWENDPVRAAQFIQEKMERERVTDRQPAVIGAVIDLGLCLNLFDQPALQELAEAHKQLQLDMAVLGLKMPENKGKDQDRMLRFLDRAVIENVHELRAGSMTPIPSYQTVRSGFHEGPEAYTGAWFKAKNHIQICVRDPACIKGFFLPRATE